MGRSNLGGLSKEGESFQRSTAMVWIDCFTIFVLVRRFFFSLTLIKPPYLKNFQGRCCGGCEVSQL